jgi:hypothetical protein
MTARIMKLCLHTQRTGVPYSGTYVGSSIPHRGTTKRPYEIWGPSSLLLNGQGRQSGRSVKLIIHLNPMVVCRISGAATYYKSLKSIHGLHWDKFRFSLISMRQLLQQISIKIHLKYAHSQAVPSWYPTLFLYELSLYIYMKIVMKFRFFFCVFQYTKCVPIITQLHLDNKIYMPT